LGKLRIHTGGTGDMLFKGNFDPDEYDRFAGHLYDGEWHCLRLSSVIACCATSTAAATVPYGWQNRLRADGEYGEHDGYIESHHEYRVVR
jgi:hypothetical protein